MQHIFASVRLLVAICMFYEPHNNSNNNHIAAAVKEETRSPSSTLFTPIKHRSSHTLLSTMFKVWVLVGETIII